MCDCAFRYHFEKKNGGLEKWQESATTEAMKTVAWREEVQANRLLERKLDKWDTFTKAWVTGIFGTDNMGHPLMVERCLPDAPPLPESAPLRSGRRRGGALPSRNQNGGAGATGPAQTCHLCRAGQLSFVRG